MKTLKQFNRENECQVQDGISPESIIYCGLISEIPDDVVNSYGGYNKLFEDLKADDDSCIIFIN